MTITLDAATEELLRAQLRTHAYASPAECIWTALEALRRQDDADFQIWKDELRRTLDERWEAAERGEVYSAGEAKAALANMRDAHRAARMG